MRLQKGSNHEDDECAFCDPFRWDAHGRRPHAPGLVRRSDCSGSAEIVVRNWGLCPENDGRVTMVAAILWGTHLLISLLMLTLPYVTRREILFGVVVPADFRTRTEGRQAIRSFQFVVAIGALAGGIMIALASSRFPAIGVLASGVTVGCGYAAFVAQNRRLKAFALQRPPVRELELSARPERLPWYGWVGLVPILLLAASALYLHNHWESLPERYPIHWNIDGQPDRWAERSAKGVYGPMIFGAEMDLWFFVFGLAIWYGTRRSEPLRKPALVAFSALGWVPALMFSGLALQPLVPVPMAAIVGGSVAIIASTVVYLIRRNRQARGPVDSTPNECWKGGILYYNPDDPVLFVGRRDGAGFTLNLANRWSWVVVISPLAIGISAFLVLS